MKNKIVFPTKDTEGNALELAVVRPDRNVQDEAQREYNKAFRNAIESKAILRLKVLDVMREQNMWNEDKEKEVEKLKTIIREGEKKLAAGGLKLSEGKEIALKMVESRNELRSLMSEQNYLDANTAEAQAENAKFNYLLSKCLVNSETGKSYYESFDEYMNRSTEQAALDAAAPMAAIIYNADLDGHDNKLPENKFLKKYKFVDEKLRFINKEGKLVTRDGKLVNEEGRFVNEKGEYVDVNGSRVDKDGNLLVEFKPFLDENGKPILEDSEVVAAEEE